MVGGVVGTGGIVYTNSKQNLVQQLEKDDGEIPRQNLEEVGMPWPKRSNHYDTNTMVISDDYDSCMFKLKYAAATETQSERFENDEKFTKLAHDYCYTGYQDYHVEEDERKYLLKKKFAKMKKYQKEAMLEPEPTSKEVPKA